MTVTRLDICADCPSCKPLVTFKMFVCSHAPAKGGLMLSLPCVRTQDLTPHLPMQAAY
jgi:hypothetical protein